MGRRQRDRDIPLARKPWSHPDAIEWLAGEVEILGEARGMDYVPRLETWWIQDPTREALVVALDSRGLGHIWDGHHRYAIAVKYGLRTVPVILGTPLRGTMSLIHQRGEEE
jgi:hypothetical protein